jgi:uncharacterized membrane protein YdjX (TVP38/TMEM64 family)
MRMRLYLFLFALVALMLLPILVFGDSIDEYFGGEVGLRRLQAYGAWAWVVAIALIIGDLVLPVPSTAVISSLGMLYGPWIGGLLGGLGSLLAGMVAYGGCRLLGRRVHDVLVGPENIDKLDRFFNRYGLWAIALSRWMPLLPEALCCLAGLARMRFGPFLAALACGSFAMGFAFSWLGVFYSDRPVVGLVVAALIPLAVWPLVHAFVRQPAKEEPLSASPYAPH